MCNMTPRYSRRKILCASGLVAASMSGCLSAGNSTPSLAWNQQPGGRLVGVPIVHNDQVLAPVEEKADQAGDNKFSIVSLKSKTGKTQWKLKTGLNEPGRLCAADGSLFYYQSGSKIGAIRIGTQTPQWETKANVETLGTPIVDSGSVYVGLRDGRVSSLSMKDGTGEWSTEVASESVTALDTGGEHVIACGRNGTVYAVEKQSGNVTWKRTERASAFPTAVTSGSTVYTIFPDGTVSRHEISTGQKKWSVSSNAAPFKRAPGLTEETVLLGSRTRNKSSSGYVQALNRTTGEQLWSHQFENAVFPPQARNGTVVTATLTTNQPPKITSFEPEEGDIRWSYRPEAKSSTYQYAYDSPQIGRDNIITGTVDGKILALER